MARLACLILVGCASFTRLPTDADIEVLTAIGRTMHRGVAAATIAPHGDMLDSYAVAPGVRELVARNKRSSALSGVLNEQASGLVLHMSLPAYYGDGCCAIVYVEERCSGHCGWGGLIRLEKTPLGWRVSSVEQLFVA